MDIKIKQMGHEKHHTKRKPFSIDEKKIQKKNDERKKWMRNNQSREWKWQQQQKIACTVQ